MAGIPQLNYSCPGNLDIHADEGGPVYINGKQAALKKFSDSYYEAASGSVTVSLTSSPDGSTQLSYTGANGSNGICQPQQAGQGDALVGGVADPGGVSGFRFECPNDLTVTGHADSVQINGKAAQVKTFNENYMEARSGSNVISISRNADQSMAASYTGAGGANGVCSGG
ncbi:hypothetical protein [Pseudoxanthomonas dokdonensis]|uniref:hypothetical protein n=1 Tax=Pseudoxanthomonas dokdonensis TaxID=344882 RepID=UPI001B800C6E|nr:hypothetical protein [Pseudoxanthomonas dokdonensis]